jgi:hypothetical protein
MLECAIAFPAGQGLRVGELAAILRVSPKTVRWWISLTWLRSTATGFLRSH